MRILLVDAEDSPRRGPWTAQPWDLIVDLGRSSESSASEWTEQLHCPILRADLFRHGVEDMRAVREMFTAGRGRLLDEEGLDWWDLTSLVILPEAEAVLVFRRLVTEIDSKAEIWASRRSWATKVVELLLHRPMQFFAGGFLPNLYAQARHYRNVFSRFSIAQLKEIALDRFDAGYQLRSKFSSPDSRFADPVVLLPSAYENVSRMAAAYAAMLPEQPFLLVATRRSAKRFTPPPNVHVRDLACYAGEDGAEREIKKLCEDWGKLNRALSANAELDILSQSGAMDHMPGWFRDGLHARNAWRAVIEREPVSGVLCGDDSNIFTRLPVLLAERRQIPTVDFHHGAMDGRYLLKDVSCDVYLAKNDVERDYLVNTCGFPAQKIEIAAPAVRERSGAVQGKSKRDSIVLFSEPYEVAGLRCEEVYCEILPPLVRLARQCGHSLIIKLHPFESLSTREKIVRSVVPGEDRPIVSIIEGPLTEQILKRAWCGITIESTTVIDCLLHGIPCFLCGWLPFSSFGYARQYLKFGIGENLRSADEIMEMAQKVAGFDDQAKKESLLSKTVDPVVLRQWLAEPHPEHVARRVS